MQKGDFSNIRAVILAAGLSSRMEGRPKALQPVGEVTMLGAALRAFSQAGVPGVRVVTGHRNGEVAEEALRYGGIPVYNPDFMQGMFTSVSAGLSDVEDERHYLRYPPMEVERMELEGLDKEAILEQLTSPSEPSGDEEERPGIDAVFIMPVDAALIRAQSITAMATAWQSLAPGLRNKAVFIPAFGEQCGHPPLFGSDHILPLIMWQGDGQWQDQWQWRGGLRHYLCTLLSDEAVRRFCGGRPPGRPPLALTASPPALVDMAVPEPREGSPDAAVFFLSLPDAGITADMDAPEDVAAAVSFLENTRGRRDPAPGEAWEWLRLSGLSEEKIRHCIMVALGALRLGLTLRRAGLAVDPALGVCGGLLHDMARNQMGHARAGAELLRREGWEDCAMVVGAHTVLPDAMLEALGIDARDLPVGAGDRPGTEAVRMFRPEVLHAALCVYLSDKFWHGANPVSIDARFAVVKEHFAGNDAALAAVVHRQGIARTVAEHVTALAGKDAEALVRAPADHTLDLWLQKLISNPEPASEDINACGL